MIEVASKQYHKLPSLENPYELVGLLRGAFVVVVVLGVGRGACVVLRFILRLQAKGGYGCHVTVHVTVADKRWLQGVIFTMSSHA